MFLFTRKVTPKYLQSQPTSAWHAEALSAGKFCENRYTEEAKINRE